MSAKGRKQAKAVGRYFAGRFPRTRPLLLSSPKARCVETLEPIAKRLGRPIARTELLDEERAGEGMSGLRRRLRRFIEWWKREAPALTVVSSHGDWLPPAIEELTGARAELKKGGWAEIVIEEPGGQPKLFTLIQEFTD